MTTSRIIDTSPRPRRIVDTSARPALLNAQAVADALGARATTASLGPDNGPMALWQVRDVMQSMLASTGGRPALTGADDRVKIPRIEADWLEIDNIIVAVADGSGMRPSPGQMAAVLLHMAVQQFTPQQVRAAYQGAVTA